MSASRPPLRLFLSYSHRDDALRLQLITFLKPLERDRLIEPWFDGRIEVGQDLNEEIAQHLNHAAIILLLVTPEFLASSYCYDQELAHALARHDANAARVIPIIMDYCDWKHSRFRHLKAVPRDGRPLLAWPNPNEALLDVTTEVRKAIDTLYNDASPAKTSDGLCIQFIHHVNLPVQNLTRSLDFYIGVLGLKEAANPPRPNFGFAGAWLQVGKYQHLHLVEYPEGTYRTHPSIGFHETKDCHFAIQVPSFDVALAHLKAKGYTDERTSGEPQGSVKHLTVDPHANPAGFQQIYLTDPDGHIIEIHQYRPQLRAM